MEENKLIKFEGDALQKVTNSIAITSKLLAMVENQKIINFFLSHPDFFIKIIPRYYPLNDRLIGKYINKWDWNELSQNKNLSWSGLLLKRFSDYWNWNDRYYSLSNSSSIPWSIELIEMFLEKWHWGQNGLSANKHLPWTIELLRKYESKLDWEELSMSQNLPWSAELIELFKNKWSWAISSDIDNWGKSYPGGLSANKNLPWEIGLIKIYEDKWDWNCLSKNRGLPWSVELIEAFEQKWNWKLLTELSLPLEIMQEFKNKIVLQYHESPKPAEKKFSGYVEKYKVNEYYKNPIERRPLFEDVYGWVNSNVGKQVWDTDLIKKFEDRWEWYFLSQNKSLPWTIELIKKFENHWDWSRLSANEQLPWSFELIKTFENKLDWNWLSHGNENFPWSIELLENFDNKWIWDYISSNDLVWEKVFKPFVDEAMIDIVMKRIDN